MSDLAPLRHRPARRLDDARLAFRIAKSALVDPFRPLIANLIVTRRCNLACGYCHEYDKVSPPVPLDVLKERIDHLARLRAVFVTLTGGESLLVPHLAEVVAYVREKGMVPFVNTNGYLLTRAWIERLDAGGPLRPADQHRQRDAERRHQEVAEGAVTQAPAARAVREVPRPHQHRPRLGPARGGRRGRAGGDGPRPRRVELVAPSRHGRRGRDGRGHARGVRRDPRARPRAHPLLDDDFQVALANGEEADWKCRAGARTFHVCEDGLVHLCAPKMGSPGTPLAAYTLDDIKRAFYMPKPCAKSCPVAYAHHVSRLDRYRSQPGEPLQLPASTTAPDGKRHLPVLAA